MLHVESIQSRSRLHRWQIAAHTHRGLHQILWVAEGPAAISLEDRHERCRGPVAIVVPPGTVHAFNCSPHTVGHVLTLDPRGVIEGVAARTGDAFDALFRIPRILHFEVASEAAQRLAALMSDLAAEFLCADAAGSPIPLWLARAVVWRLARQGVRRADCGDRRGRALFTRFVVLAEAHHREHWPVSEYGRRLGLSTERLNRLIRAETGQSALAMLHARLTREACRRLAYTAVPIAQLALDLGFEDPAYFCRFFKRRTGQSPRDYRRTRSAA